MEYLEAKNVGPIKKAELKLKKINVFIGKNGSGKSVIAKILQVKRENESFKDYGLDEFITNESMIKYNGYSNKIKVFEKIINNIKSIVLSEEKINEELHNILKAIYSQKQSFYIPVERNLVPFFSSYGINIMASKIPLPQYVLDFATEFRLAKDMIKQKVPTVKIVKSKDEANATFAFFTKINPYFILVYKKIYLSRILHQTIGTTYSKDLATGFTKGAYYVSAVVLVYHGKRRSTSTHRALSFFKRILPLSLRSQIKSLHQNKKGSLNLFSLLFFKRKLF